jgi:hypothetical protein
VRRQEIRNGLDFNNHLSVHEDIRAKTFVELDAFVGPRNSGLPLKCDFRLLQLTAEAAFITDSSRILTRLRAAPWSFVCSVLYQVSKGLTLKCRHGRA